MALAGAATVGEHHASNVSINMGGSNVTDAVAATLTVSSRNLARRTGQLVLPWTVGRWTTAQTMAPTKVVIKAGVNTDPPTVTIATLYVVNQVWDKARGLITYDLVDQTYLLADHLALADTTAPVGAAGPFLQTQLRLMTGSSTLIVNQPDSASANGLAYQQGTRGDRVAEQVCAAVSGSLVAHPSTVDRFDIVYDPTSVSGTVQATLKTGSGGTLSNLTRTQNRNGFCNGVMCVYRNGTAKVVATAYQLTGPLRWGGPAGNVFRGFTVNDSASTSAAVTAVANTYLQRGLSAAGGVVVDAVPHWWLEPYDRVTVNDVANGESTDELVDEIRFDLTRRTMRLTTRRFD